GGDGGGGGGAFEIVALGRMTVAGELKAQGGDGDWGNMSAGNTGYDGSSGVDGDMGYDGSMSTNGGSGQDGMPGHGGDGGLGGMEGFAGGGGMGGMGGPGGMGNYEEGGNDGENGYEGWCGMYGGSMGPGMDADMGIDGSYTGNGGMIGGVGGMGGIGAAGGDQAAGGDSGAGGMGGAGGGGAGGTVKLFASVIDGTGASVNAAGGIGAQNGDSGRFLFGNNTTTAFAGSVNANQENFEGSRDTNPFIDGGTTQTPYIPGLDGGAEVYGKTTLDASDPGFRTELSALFSSLTNNDMAALYRMDVGPTGFSDDYDQYDMLLYIVLTDESINDPQMGVDSQSFLHQLQERGMDANPLFGGSGASDLSELAGYEVYATLIPESVESIAMEGTYGGTLLSNSTANLLTGEALLLSVMPGDANGDKIVDVSDLGIMATNYGSNDAEWSTGDFNHDGIVDVSDLGILASNYGKVSAQTVPEPSTFAGLLGLCLAGLLSSARGRR
ncbi:MAG: PEP-CTERM sorting domain-containing protein, partial [Pirellulales bacterium]|nr:PEP-CTERM sorting domain-containing protein [Pirellulales bacterium]